MKLYKIILGTYLLSYIFFASNVLGQTKNNKPTEKKPNVILIITDDQGYGDLSCHGNSLIKTPNMDQLFQESTRLADFHVSPTCSPTRAALMTGHYSNRTGVWHTIGGRSLLKEGEVTMADVFAANGYATGIFGKWHLGDNYPFRPQDRGFQEVLVHGGGGIGQGPDYWDNNYFDDTYFHNGEPEKFTGYCTDVWFDNAIKFIDENHQEDEPFFCYLSTNAPHSPYSISNEYVEPYNNNDSIPVPAFNGMISNIDENLGKLMNYLKRNGLEENTILVFMADNGTSAGVNFKNRGSEVDKGFNAGMRGKKGSMYEGGHRVPFFIRWPKGNIAAGKDINDLTAHIDILPTFIDMLDLEMPYEVVFDGSSLKSILLGQTDHLPLRTLITDSQRLEQPVKWRQSSVMHGSWRLINGEELYDISLDPGQQNNIAPENPKMVKQLQESYENWWKDISPTFENVPAIQLCPPQEPVTLLRTHDMHMDDDKNLVPWNQKQVREGMKSNGWFEVNVLEQGIYKFTLMRWPPEVHAGMLASIRAKPSLPGTTVGKVVAGADLKIRQAAITLDEIEQNQTVSSSVGEGIVFEMPIEVGKHKLRAWFTDDKEESFAAYYVIVEKN
ncbi:MAG: arylsulfatase [Anditalea sp.]